ncbi:hypothetical protein GQ457_06G006620 [Hibiscus cannabinus]
MVLPKKTCNELERLLRRFIWGIKKDNSRIHVVKFDDVCQPVGRGSLGFRELQQQNETIFLMKITFDLLTKNETLWVCFLRAKYKVIDLVRHTLKNTNVSRLWKGLSLVWEDIRNNIF